MDFPLDVRWLHSECGPALNAKIRQQNDYFQVDEVLGFEPEGEGEHFYVQIRKDGQNTHWVKEQLASQLGLHPRDIGHSGLKDRHAITSQWLSLYMPKQDPELEKVQIDGVQLLQAKRHLRKLKPGTHESNRFSIRLTEVAANQKNQESQEQVESILNAIKTEGFPNYFGNQRFGRDGANLPKAWKLLQQRRLNKHKKKSIYLSSLRSFLFNQVLNASIADSSQELETDGNGPLWGRGRLNIAQQQAEFETSVLQPWQEICEALEYSGLQQERRALRTLPIDLSWSWLGDGNELLLNFQLPSGSYATSLLREIAQIVDIKANLVEHP